MKLRALRQGNIHRAAGKVLAMSSSRPSAYAARTVLVVSALVCTIIMVGPFQGVEEAVVPWDKAAHFLAFWGFTALLYVAFPDRRRFDLTLMAVLAGAGIELAQQLSGRDAEMGDIAADAAGAFAVLAPLWIERLRGAPLGERRRGPAWLRRASILFSASGRRRRRSAPPAAG
jgi:VanZ family protein